MSAKPVLNPKACIARRRRVVRVLRYYSTRVAKIPLTKNRVKIRRAADIEVKATIMFGSFLLAELAGVLEAKS